MHILANMSTAPERHPWEQLPGESGPAYRAFLVYRDLGPDRTVNLASRKLAEMPSPEGARKRRGKAAEGPRKGAENPKPGASGQIRKWSKGYSWAERATAYDQHLARAKVRGETKAVESYAAKRKRQALEGEDVAIAAAVQLKIDALSILKTPLFTATDTITETDAEGRPVTIHRTIEPAGWRRRDAAFMLKVARDLEDTVFHFSRRETEQEVSTQADAGPRIPTDGVSTEAVRRIELHRAAMRTKMLKLSVHPPSGFHEDGSNMSESGMGAG
ncbi:hypothetical protein [Singulisphaera sp. PoT]|uniref:hypothetical protein n=1 Tax=Singulisphaera sp. PoT TaxID=3411797 RepID=UPI003BF52819